MEEVPYKRKGRWFQEFLIIMCNFCAMLPYLAPTVIMGDIMQTFGADMGVVGLSITVQLVASGVCMFIGSAVGDKIGTLRTIQLGAACLFAGVLVQSFAPNIAIFIIGRAIAGLGQGLATVMATPLISSWFEGEERSFGITFNGVASAIGIAVTVAAIGPLSAALGGWQRGFMVYAAITLVLAVLWFTMGKASPELIAQEAAQKEMAAAASGQQSSISLALHDAQCWKVMIFFSVFIIVDSARSTFLPTYMGTIGIPGNVITTATSVLSLIGMVGSLLGGTLVAKIAKRKPILLVSCGCYLVCGLLVTLISATVPNVAAAILLGFFYNLPITASTMLLIEHAMGKNPAMISGGTAMMSGTGMLLTIIVSPLFTALTNALGMGGAFRVFFLLLIACIVATVLMEETGRKPEKAD